MGNLRVVSVEDERARRRAEARLAIRQPVSVWGADGIVEMLIAHGEMDVPILGRPLREYLGVQHGFNQQAAGEMLTTPPNLTDFVRKTVVDLQIGREQIPLLYQPLYRTISDPNLTEDVDVGTVTTAANVVFLEHISGQEVAWGTRELVAGQTVKILTYSAGFEYDEDMVEWDRTWQVTQLNEAFGRGYNALLNHLYLYPLLSYTYAAKNQTAAYSASSEFMINMRTTLKNAMIHAGQDKLADTGVGRSPTVMIAHSSRRWDIEEALQRFTFNGTEYPALSGIDTIIFYDGTSIKMGAKTYPYPGCATTKAYLVEPGQYLIELIKHDLRVDAVPGDLSRLIAQQIVGRARRGAFISPANSVEEITLP